MRIHCVSVSSWLTPSRLIGFEDLGHNDHFTTAALEWRLQQTGALPSGPITLANSLSIGAAVGKSGEGSGDESEGDDESRRRGKMGGGRKGKVGIRNGLASGTRDDDEY